MTALRCRRPGAWRFLGLGLGLGFLLLPAIARSQPLPADALAALRRAQVPPEALSVVIQDLNSGRRVLSWQADRPVNPASLLKLVTTTAALDQLGPAWAWTTPVWIVGPLQNGVLDGSVHIRGSGDPKLVLERLWLLLRRLQGQGVREIRGDIVLDNSAFAVPEAAPGDFDGEALRPYNVQPAALLLNFRSVLYSFVPDTAAGVARVQVEPRLDGTEVTRTVPLATGPCEAWQAALKASFEPGRTRFAGAYPASCGEQTWPVADPQAASFDARLIGTMWRELGGVLKGSVREGPAPADLRPSFEWRSPPLADVVRDINKYSNNLMAQQLFLTLALQAAPRPPATPDMARSVLKTWLRARAGAGGDEVVIDNGSGLSRLTRLSAAQLAAVLQTAWDSPVMSELMSSLPIAGVDGSLRKARAAGGRAQLKSGTLRDVAGVAGYVLSDTGRRHLLVAIINHPQANGARGALDALVQWTLKDAGSK